MARIPPRSVRLQAIFVCAFVSMHATPSLEPKKRCQQAHRLPASPDASSDRFEPPKGVPCRCLLRLGTCEALQTRRCPAEVPTASEGTGKTLWMDRHATVTRKRPVAAHGHPEVRRSRTWRLHNELCLLQRPTRRGHTQKQDTRALPLPCHTLILIHRGRLIVAATTVTSPPSASPLMWWCGCRW